MLHGSYQLMYQYDCDVKYFDVLRCQLIVISPVIVS